MFTQPLMATCWTTAGDAASDRTDLRSPLPLRDRVEAASRAGFSGFGLLSADLPEAERAYGMTGIRSIFADNGITHVELEGLPHWWGASGAERAASEETRRLLLRAAEALGARHIKVGPDGSGLPWDLGRWAAAFGQLAGEAAGCGARLGIEFLPWMNVATVHDGLRLVEEAGHEGGGVIIDSWHTERAGTPASELAAIPVERIVGVELDDADARMIGTMFEDTVHRRRYCGEGDLDLVGIISALHGAGWRGPWGIEILSVEHRALDVATASAKAFDTGYEVLSRVLDRPGASGTRAARGAGS